MSRRLPQPRPGGAIAKIALIAANVGPLAIAARATAVVLAAISFAAAAAVPPATARTASAPGAAPSAPAPGAADAGPVRVVFARPERYADVADRRSGDPATAEDRTLAVLSRYLRAEAAPRLAPGQTLEVTVTDVDRAGDFEPRRGPGGDTVRVVRDVTPPRIDLAFRLLAADGSVVKSGARELRNLQFLSRREEAPVDPLRHEKRLLGDWIARELR